MLGLNQAKIENIDSKVSSFQNVKFRYLLVWIFIGFISIFVLLRAISGFFGFTSFTFKYTVSTFTYFYVFLLCYRVTQQKSISFKNLFVLKAKKINWIEVIGLTILTKVINISLLASVLLYIVYYSPQYLSSFASDTNTVEPLTNFFFLAFQAIVLAPIIEELFFRGILLQSWGVRWGVKRAIILSSFTLSVLHFSSQFLDLFVGSIVLSVLFLKYKSLIIPILFHTINNQIAQLTNFFNRGSSSNESITIEQAKAAGWVGAILFIVSFCIYVIYLKKSRIKEMSPIE
ncbi:CPBP family intramembrane glutamic endopeptidase [Falsibacillus albus]|uniref:CPBP family intramembrane metalloprotease n=1 Tax=Falsibacillus albus TaxID=2478915 RepID=A0A3L7JRV8_9BACI|nr:type II CAAX endopeptidase family protein [Falsibacillus albus]RLQ93587.1 CPBP family intramembrane metalloprotease [Falsibacillus albus]